MDKPKRGEVILVRFPFTDLQSTKLRPAVVLAVHGEDVVVVGIFSNLPVSPKNTWILISEKDSYFVQTGLKKSSIIKAEKIALLHYSVINSVIGSFHPSLMDALSQRVKTALQLP